jgi:hypothetical protein
MATFYSPKVVTDGLVLALDAANTKSFRGEPTTNLAINPQFTSTSNWSVATNGGGTFSVNGGFGKITMGTAGSFNYLNQTQALAIPPNTTATWSAFFKNDKVATFGIRLVFFDGASVPAQPTQLVVLDGAGGLKRVSVSATYTGTTTSVRLDILSGGFYSGLSNADVEFTNVQFELKPYATSFVNGTRGTTVTTGGGWADLTENSNHMEIVNGTAAVTLNGGSLLFDGIDDRTYVVNNTTYGNNTTWEAWVNRTASVNAYNMFMGRFLPYFGLVNDNRIIFSNTIGGGQRTIYSTDFASVNNTWYHLIFTTEYDNVNTIAKIYINGIFNNSGSFAGAQGNVAYKFTVGDGGNSSAWYPFNGRVSNVKVYNKTLTPQEILQNFNATRSRFGV